MKQLVLFISFLVISILGISLANGEDKHGVAAEIYVVDTSLMRLIPLECELVDNSVNIMASQLLGKITHGFDENKKIRRLIPDKRRCLSVQMQGSTAVVNIRTKYFNTLPKSREFERLVIYQIVNSLTSIEGIDYVKFTVNGQTRKDFAGFVDMREIFVPDYLV